MESKQLLRIETVSKIQNKLGSYDCRSLVFLLYDEPGDALNRITKNDGLKHWAQESIQDHKHNWQDKFIECLAICKLNGIIKKLGLDLSLVEAQYCPQVTDTSVYVDPVRKLFYHICEQITKRDLNFIIRNCSFIKDEEEIEDIEIIILKVLCEKKNIENLLSAIAKIPLLTTFVLQIRERLIDTLLYELTVHEFASTSTSRICEAIDYKITPEENYSSQYYDCPESDMAINLDEFDYYPIKKLHRVGLAYIINQQVFNSASTNYEFTDRDGSEIDKDLLERTLTKLNFKVLVSDNLTSKDIKTHIANVINHYFETNDSIFLLCILSHGIKGQIFGTDCVPVKIKEIKRIIDSEGKEKLNCIPKVIFLQACQVVERLVADGPLAIDYLIHYATSPELEAYRSKENGSIFIKVLCMMLLKHSEKEHLVDICTKVVNYVNKICNIKGKKQLPNIQITLRKKLYLR